MDKTESTAKVVRGRWFSPIWIIPLVSLITLGWMAYQYITQRGPEIYLTMQTADGIRIGQTKVKARSVKVGLVTDVKLSKNYNQIELTVRMDGGTERMLHEDSEFWVVKPRIGAGGISGLETLLSGAYIELSPGKSNKKQNHFIMRNEPPITNPNAKGTRVTLVSREAGKLTVGDPVMYEGYVVGRVEKTGFDVDQRRASYQLFIFQPYSDLLRTRSQFWLNSGLNISLNAQGFNVGIGSLETLISGGVTFAVPQGSPKGKPLDSNIPEFTLYDNAQDAQANMYEKVVSYALLFDNSVRGLSVGAPVDYRGIRIGTVTKVPLIPDKISSVDSRRIPILIDIQLERIEQISGDDTSATLFDQRFSQAMKKGLRATLQTGNLLTGAQFVNLDFYPEEAEKFLSTDQEKYHGYTVLPTINGGFAMLQQQAEQILGKIEKLPIDTTVNQLNKTLNQFGKVGQQLQITLKQFDTLLAQRDTQQLPQSMRNTLAQLQSTLKAYGPNSTSHAEFKHTLLRINEALGELRPLLETLNEKPDALIFGSQKGRDPVPVRGVRP